MCWSWTTSPKSGRSSAKSLRPRATARAPFHSGTAALQIAPTERPALILLNISLPDLDGYTVASRLRAVPALAHTPIIFITGADAPVHGTLSRGLGAIYLKKPFTTAQLLRAVGQALQGSAEAR